MSVVKFRLHKVSNDTTRPMAQVEVTIPSREPVMVMLSEGYTTVFPLPEHELVNAEAPAEPAPEVFNARQRAWEKAGELLGGQAYPEQILALAQWLHEGEEG